MTQSIIIISIFFSAFLLVVSFSSKETYSRIVAGAFILVTEFVSKDADIDDQSCVVDTGMCLLPLPSDYY